MPQSTAATGLIIKKLPFRPFPEVRVYVPTSRGWPQVERDQPAGVHRETALPETGDDTGNNDNQRENRRASRVEREERERS